MIVSFFLAVGIVWIKGQERIVPRTLFNIPVSVENLGENLVLPDNWLRPTAALTIQGPRNTIDLISESAFTIDLSKIDIPEDGSPLIVTLRSDMFRTNLMNPNDRLRISVNEDEIIPQQVAIHFLEWDIDKPPPNYKDIPDTANQLIIPVYQLVKHVPIVVPHRGALGEDFTLDRIISDPETVAVTGRREAIDRIKSVSTPLLDLNFFDEEQNPLSLPLTGLEGTYNVRLVNDAIRHVTVTVQLKKK